MPAKGDKIPCPDDCAARYLELGSMIAVAEHYGVSREVATRWIGEVTPTIRQYELTDIPKGRPAAMLRERDLDPEVWQVRGLRVNEWEVTSTDENGDPLTSTNRQTRLDIVPRLNILRAARPDGWKPPKPKRSRATGETDSLIIGDHQAPYHDAPMHKAVVNWLAEVQPRRGVILGDLLDLPSVSKYAKKINYHAAVNECVDAAYRILCDYRSASPDTEFSFLQGNHEKRLVDTLFRDFDEGASIRRADEEVPVLNLAYLLRLDELGIPFLENYPHDVLKLSPTTAVIHGSKSKPGAGATAQAETKDRRYHVFIGHNHKQAITPFTNHDIDGQISVTYGIEVGASCQVVGGLGYAVRPDWQQGAATATFDKDGTMTPELLNWSGGKLRWRGDWWK